MLLKIKSLRISARLTLLYASILISILFVTSSLAAIGLYVSVYHQASVEMRRTIEHTLEVVERTNAMPETALPPKTSEMNEEYVIKRQAEDPEWDPPPRAVMSLFREGAIMPGVVLRITNEKGRLVFNNAEHFPHYRDIEEAEVAEAPFWANRELDVSIMDNFHFYFKNVPVTWRGREYTLHFSRMITAERQFMHVLANGFFFINFFGLLIALFAGYFVSRKTLKPIRTITRTAQDIEVSDLSRRIPEPPADDELKQLVLTINHMLDRLEAGFKQQQRFVSDASHELRTPVTVILGYADMLSRWGKDDPETLSEAVEDIRSEAEDMKGLIERLLFLARADMNRQVLYKEPLEMQELLESVAKKASMAETTHKIMLLKNEPGTIFGDGVTIRQMLRVFIENAIKYSEKGTEIALSSERDGDFLTVMVADQGIGIAPENQKKVFERFVRVDSSRTSSEGGVSGTGLGMAIARWIADAHGITLSIESELGKGTKIFMKIPLMKENIESLPESKAVGDGPKLHKS